MQRTAHSNSSLDTESDDIIYVIYSVYSRPSRLDCVPEETDSDALYRSANGDFSNDEESLIEWPQAAPPDRFYFTYIAFCLLGMTINLPWNFFITAESYWMYKFRNVSGNGTTDITPMQATFIPDLSIAGSITGTAFQILSAIVGHKIRLSVRMNCSLMVIFLVFVMSTALIKVNTDQWQETFFSVSIASQVVMSMATATLSGGLFGVCGRFPSQYMTAAVSGLALCGIFAAIVEIVTITFCTDDRESAFIFFIVGNVLCVLAVISCIILSRTDHFLFYSSEERVYIEVRRNEQRMSAIVLTPSFKAILSKIWVYGISGGLVYVVTMCVYPAITTHVNSIAHGRGYLWNDVYFIPVTNYLVYSLGDYLGRIVAGKFVWPNGRPYVIVLLTMYRLAFLPALLLCNTVPRHTLPVLVHSDWMFILLMCAFSFTNGYLANLALICAPQRVLNHEKEMAASTMASLISLGSTFGSAISLILVQSI